MHCQYIDPWCPGSLLRQDISNHGIEVVQLEYSGPWFNIKMPSYQYKKSHYGDKTVVRLSYLHNGISYTG